MSCLSADQLQSLNQMGIPLDRVFDASGQSTMQYKEAMRKVGAWIAFGVTPCSASGYSLRVRSGHCVQCRPENISYLRRFDEEGEVYIAESLRGNLVKVGTAKNSEARVQQLNVYQYGQRADWTLRFRVSAAKAGRVESEVHRRLSPYSAGGSYFKGGDFITSRETFACTHDQALGAVKAAIACLR